MASRPQGTKYKKMTGTGAVMTGIGNLYSVFLSWRGVTAGDRVLIVDGTSPAGTVMEEIILSDANSNGITVPMPAVGKEFGTGLYVVAALTGGEFDLSLGYDGNG